MVLMFKDISSKELFTDGIYMLPQGKELAQVIGDDFYLSLRCTHFKIPVKEVTYYVDRALFYPTLVVILMTRKNNKRLYEHALTYLPDSVDNLKEILISLYDVLLYEYRTDILKYV